MFLYNRKHFIVRHSFQQKISNKKRFISANKAENKILDQLQYRCCKNDFSFYTHFAFNLMNQSETLNFPSRLWKKEKNKRRRRRRRQELKIVWKNNSIISRYLFNSIFINLKVISHLKSKSLA